MSEVLLISQTDVPRLLPMGECIGIMHDTLIALTEGRTILPLRTVIPLPQQRGAFASMPAILESPDAFGIKVISVYPGNHGTEFDSHQGAVLLFEPQHGSLVAILDASSITAIRTAAVSAVATRALARPDASSLALIGSGVQAATHLEAMLAVRHFTRVRVFSRNREHAQAFALRESQRNNVDVQVVADARTAVQGADVVCTVSSARTPVLLGEWLQPGMHVNAVGASTRGTRELDGLALQRSRLYADRRESLLNEAGDFLMARDEGFVNNEHVLGEVGELLTGSVAGRVGPDDITLFKSLGLAIEDVASADYIYQRARRLPDLPRVNLGGARH